MSTVYPIIPSIEPDKTSLTVSVMDDDGGLVAVCWIFGVVKFGCALVSPLVANKTKLMREMV